MTETQTGDERASIILDELIATIAQRAKEMPEGSYTTKLLRDGVDRIGRKIGEESAEVIIAAKNGDPDPLANEAADLIYHLLVMLRACDVPIEAVWEVLGRRHGPAQDAATR